MADLCYEPASLCGPVDMRVVRFIEQYRGHPFDPSYLDHVQKWHGGIPGKQYFDAQNGKTYRVGRFLTLVDEQTELNQPAQPSWEFPRQDIRCDRSILHLIDNDGVVSQTLYGGERLIPFASLYWRGQHPDEMGFGEWGIIDLLAFDYGAGPNPSIVIALADQAGAENLRWNKAVKASGYDGSEKVRYRDFTVAVAVDFKSFLERLRLHP